MVGSKKAGTLVGSGKLKPKKEKKAKEGPKRAPSSYLLFCADKRSEVTDEGFKGADVMKELGRRWKELDNEGKRPYETAALEAKDKLEEEKQSGESTKASRSKSPGKGKKNNTTSSRSLSPPKGKSKALDESMEEEKKPKRGRKKCGGC